MSRKNEQFIEDVLNATFENDDESSLGDLSDVVDDSDADPNFVLDNDDYSTDSEIVDDPRPSTSGIPLIPPPASSDSSDCEMADDTSPFPRQASAARSVAAARRATSQRTLNPIDVRYTNLVWTDPVGKHRTFEFTGESGLRPETSGILEMAQPNQHLRNPAGTQS